MCEGWKVEERKECNITEGWVFSHNLGHIEDPSVPFLSGLSTLRQSEVICNISLPLAAS